MADTTEPTLIPLLSRALNHIRSTPPRVIASPATQPRRAAVALIIRVSPPPSYVFPQSDAASPANASAPSLSDFFQLDWVNAPGARPELLFIRRDSPDPNDAGHLSGSGPRTHDPHVAFPGGKTEEGDEGGLYTAMRQTWEEIGLDLAESDYTTIGQLDDREITTSLGKRLLMVLSPFVFLQLSPRTTPVDPAPGTALHWIPLTTLLPIGSARPRWSAVSVDASARLAPRHSTVLRLLMRLLIGNMQFPALVIPPSPVRLTPNVDTRAIDAKRAHLESGAGPALRRQSSLSTLRRRPAPPEELKLWGLSLGMTLDLLAHMATGEEKGKARERLSASALLPPDADSAGGMLRVPVVAPSLVSVFPRFSYPDVNFWIWVFGKRYRAVVRGWETSVRAGGTNDRRINWTGSALTTFYAAVRKALVVVLVLRAIGVLVALLVGAWIVCW
ncbi:hypothetical protein B0H21DRAFT_786614 [Amylocystis lapponica]|nr:hypothetical protein B0H21DRAFT_786614 [Amylocystis lapponica]